MKTPSLRSAAALAAVTLLLAVGIGSAETITVDAQVTTGTRTFALKTLAGGGLDALTLGAAGERGFVTSVTDERYERVGYQVTATMSNLYKVTNGTFDCTRSIPASGLGIGFLASPVSVSDVAGLVEPVWDLAGTLTGALATTLGVASGTAFAVTAFPGERVEHALAGTFTGLQDALPIKVAPGPGGSFTAPAAHPTCGSGAGSPTSRLLMNGTGSNLAALFTWLQDAIMTAADVGGDAAVDAAELVATGAADDPTLAAATRAALASAGVSLTLLDALIAANTVTMTQLYELLDATLRPVTALVGQTGSYLALPKLTLSIPDGTPPGTYRGTLTVTQVDVP
jgi:hypothetical protein